MLETCRGFFFASTKVSRKFQEQSRNGSRNVSEATVRRMVGVITEIVLPERFRMSHGVLLRCRRFVHRRSFQEQAECSPPTGAHSGSGQENNIFNEDYNTSTSLLTDTSVGLAEYPLQCSLLHTSHSEVTLFCLVRARLNCPSSLRSNTYRQSDPFSA